MGKNVRKHKMLSGGNLKHSEAYQSWMKNEKKNVINARNEWQETQSNFSLFLFIQHYA